MHTNNGAVRLIGFSSLPPSARPVDLETRGADDGECSGDRSGGADASDGGGGASADGGRYLVAQRNILAGELIHASLPFMTAMPSRSRALPYCRHCLREGGLAPTSAKGMVRSCEAPSSFSSPATATTCMIKCLPTRGCGSGGAFQFCSTACEEAHHYHHHHSGGRWECAAIGLIRSTVVVPPPPTAAATRDDDESSDWDDDCDCGSDGDGSGGVSTRPPNGHSPTTATAFNAASSSVPKRMKRHQHSHMGKGLLPRGGRGGGGRGGARMGSARGAVRGGAKSLPSSPPSPPLAVVGGVDDDDEHFLVLLTAMLLRIEADERARPVMPPLSRPSTPTPTPSTDHHCQQQQQQAARWLMEELPSQYQKQRHQHGDDVDADDDDGPSQPPLEVADPRYLSFPTPISSSSPLTSSHSGDGHGAVVIDDLSALSSQRLLEALQAHESIVMRMGGCEGGAHCCGPRPPHSQAALRASYMCRGVRVGSNNDASSPHPPTLPTPAMPLTPPQWVDVAAMVTNLSSIPMDRRAEYAVLHGMYERMRLRWEEERRGHCGCGGCERENSSSGGSSSCCGPEKVGGSTTCMDGAPLLRPCCPPPPPSPRPPRVSLSLFSSLCAALQCNGFGVYRSSSSYPSSCAQKQKKECLAIGFYPFASYFNHSCRPNLGRLMVGWGGGGCGAADIADSGHHQSGSTRHSGGGGDRYHLALDGRSSSSLGVEARFYALRPIAEGEPLCISYIDIDKPRGERRRVLYDSYRFICGCDRCKEEEEAEEEEAEVKREGAAAAAGGESLAAGRSSSTAPPLPRRCSRCAARGYLRPLLFGAAPMVSSSPQSPPADAAAIYRPLLSSRTTTTTITAANIGAAPPMDALTAATSTTASPPQASYECTVCYALY